MSDGRCYILDANVFIQAKNEYYAFAFCPGFWQALIQNHALGRVRSVDKVLGELVDYGDELSVWVKNTMPTDCFLSTESEEIAVAYGTIMDWVTGNDQFMQYAKDAFATEQDAWIAAYALVHGHTVVTQEVHHPKRRNKVSLAHVCEHFGIRYINTFTLLRELNVSMVCPDD